MIRRVLTACLVEWLKYSRSPFPYLGLAVVAGLAAATMLIHPVVRDGLSDFAFIAQAVPSALNLAGFLMCTIYSAGLVAAEVDSGTIRTLLVRPIQRHELLCAKLLNGMAYATLLTFSAVLSAWVCAIALGELSGIAFSGELTYATNEIYMALVLAALFNLPPYFAGVAYAVFLSTATRRPAVAIGLAVGGWLLVDYLKYPLGVSRAVFTTYLDQSWIVFQDRCNALETPFLPGSAYAAVISAAWFAAFALASMFIFGRRSFGS